MVSADDGQAGSRAGQRWTWDRLPLHELLGTARIQLALDVLSLPLELLAQLLLAELILQLVPVERVCQPRLGSRRMDQPEDEGEGQRVAHALILGAAWGAVNSTERIRTVGSTT